MATGVAIGALGLGGRSGPALILLVGTFVAAVGLFSGIERAVTVGRAATEADGNGGAGAAVESGDP